MISRFTVRSKQFFRVSLRHFLHSVVFDFDPLKSCNHRSLTKFLPIFIVESRRSCNIDVPQSKEMEIFLITIVPPRLLLSFANFLSSPFVLSFFFSLFFFLPIFNHFWVVTHSNFTFLHWVINRTRISIRFIAPFLRKDNLFQRLRFLNQKLKFLFFFNIP